MAPACSASAWAGAERPVAGRGSSPATVRARSQPPSSETFRRRSGGPDWMAVAPAASLLPVPAPSPWAVWRRKRSRQATSRAARASIWPTVGRRWPRSLPPSCRRSSSAISRRACARTRPGSACGRGDGGRRGSGRRTGVAARARSRPPGREAVRACGRCPGGDRRRARAASATGTAGRDDHAVARRSRGRSAREDDRPPRGRNRTRAVRRTAAHPVTRARRPPAPGRRARGRCTRTPTARDCLSVCSPIDVRPATGPDLAELADQIRSVVLKSVQLPAFGSSSVLTGLSA